MSNRITMARMFTCLLSLISLTTISQAQTNCACCTVNHKQFDFWVGDWLVYDTIGNKVGENLIVKLEENCIVSEHWKGAKGLTGRSYNYFDKTDSTWNQVWIDNVGSNLVLKGKVEGNKMILKSELYKGTKVDWYSNRITWSKNNDGSVTQRWEILDKNNKVLALSFIGIYKRK